MKKITIHPHEQQAVNQLLKVMREPRSPTRPVTLVVLFIGDKVSITRADPRGVVQVNNGG